MIIDVKIIHENATKLLIEYQFFDKKNFRNSQYE